MPGSSARHPLIPPSARLRLGAPGFWSYHLTALAAAWLGLLVVFWADAAQMVQFWLTNPTYKHCALVLPIIGWLVWQRAPELRPLPLGIWWPALFGVGLALLIWLVGAAGEIGLLRHAGLIFALQAIVPLVLGKTVGRALLFPIFYLVFAIPFGEEIVPFLQTLTAIMSIKILHLIDTPAVLDGIFIATPNGLYRVAQNCAGVKFLLAMLSYGVLVAHLCFQSFARRLAFVVYAVVLPIVANGFRAAATIYIGYRTSPEIAGGVDHIVYGWLFFAIVMIIMFASGWPFFERRPGDPWLTHGSLPEAGAPRSPVPALAASLGLALLVFSWADHANASGVTPLKRTPALPMVEGWTLQKSSTTRFWRPHYRGADQSAFGTYKSPNGQMVDLSIVLFSRQEDGRELIGFGQGAAGKIAQHWVWSAKGPAFPEARSEIIVAPGGIRRLVVTAYVVGGQPMGEPWMLKLRTIFARLGGQDQSAAAIIISTQETQGRAWQVDLTDFQKALGPAKNVARAAFTSAQR